MDLNKLVLCLSLMTASCVPVRYDSIVWNRQGGTPASHDGVVVDPALRSGNPSFLNSANRGPWQLVIPFRSRRNCEIHLSSAVIRGGGTVRTIAIDRKIPLEFLPKAGDWHGAYFTEESFSLPIGQEGMIHVDVYLRVGSGGIYKVTSSFKGTRITGTETVNVLTM